MTLDTPAWLLLLGAVPVVWWLHRTASRPGVIVVASVDLFRGARTDASVRPRRAADAALACILGAIGLLALCAAGPGIGAASDDEVLVLVDRSASMEALSRGPGRTSAADDAATVLSGLLSRAAPRAVARREDLTATTTQELVLEAAEGLDAVRRHGFRGAILLTDRQVDAGPGIVVVGPREGRGPNAALSAAALSGERALVTVMNHAGVDAACTVGGDAATVELAVAAGDHATAVLPAPPRGGSTTFRLRARFADGSEDSLARDDRLSVRRAGGRGLPRARLATPSPRLSALLEILAQEAGGEIEIDVRNGPGAEGDGVVFVPAGSAGAGSREVAGASLRATGLLDLALPSPSAVLVATGRLADDGAALADTEGTLVRVLGARVEIALDPEDPLSTWHRDPSFPVLVAAALEHLAGGPPRLEWTQGVPPAQSVLPTEGVPEPSLESVAAIVRPAREDGSRTDLSPWFAGAAAVLVAAAVVLGRRSGR